MKTVALNFVEEAKKKGIEVATTQLAGLLNVPVFPTHPLKRKGIDPLIDGILTAASGHGFTLTYDDHIERAIAMVEEALVGELPFSKRFIALRILEGDTDLESYLKNSFILSHVEKAIPEHPNLKSDIAVNRHGVAAYLARLVTTFTKREHSRDWKERLDMILLHPKWGLAMTFAVFLGLFAGLLWLGGLVQNSLSSLIQTTILPGMNSVTSTLPLYIGTMVNSAVIGTSAGIAIAIPYVFLFYFFLGLLEDLGVLPRFILTLGIYLLSFLLLVGVGTLIRWISFKPPAPLLLELPPYRRPVLKGVVVKSWLRMREFVYVVIPLLALGGASYGLLKGFNLEGALFDPLRFLTVGWLHLPKEVATPLVYGFLQKDLTPAMLVSVSGTMNISSFMTPLQIFTFGMASTFQVPCIVALGMMIRQIGLRWTAAITGAALATGLLVSGVVLRIVLLVRGFLT